MGGSGTAKVVLSHVLSDTVKTTWSGSWTRTIKYQIHSVETPRPAHGSTPFRLNCPTCEGELLIELLNQKQTDGARIRRFVASAVCLILFVVSLGYAVHVGGQTLPEGASLSPLFPISVLTVFASFVAGPTLFFAGKYFGGVKMVEAPKPRKGHRIGASDARRTKPAAAIPQRDRSGRVSGR